jgi:hypothetical protein
MYENIIFDGRTDNISKSFYTQIFYQNVVKAIYNYLKYYTDKKENQIFLI